MTAGASERLSAAKTGWVIVALLAGWLVFFFGPFGHEEKPEPPRVELPRSGEAELKAVGLSYNVDWIGLPEYFAVWASRPDWRDDRMYFAYWNPVTKSYSYSFEVTRRGSSYRFRSIARAELNAKIEATYESREGELIDELPEPDGEVGTHPFLFPSDYVFKITAPGHEHSHRDEKPIFKKQPIDPVKLNIAPPEITVPKPDPIDSAAQAPRKN